MRRLALLLMVLFIATACTARSELWVAFDGATSGEAAVVAAADSDLREALAMDAPGEVEWDDVDFVAEMFGLEGLEDDGYKLEAYRDGDFAGVKASKKFNSLDELSDILAEAMDSEEAGLVFVSDGKTVTMSAPDFVAGAGADIAELREMGELLKVELGLRVKMPGEVSSHNATEVASDGTLVWEYNLTDGSGFAAPEAVSKTSGGGFPVVPLVLAVMAVAGISYVVATSRNPEAAVGSGVAEGLFPEELASDEEE